MSVSFLFPGVSCKAICILSQSHQTGDFNLAATRETPQTSTCHQSLLPPLFTKSLPTLVLQSRSSDSPCNGATGCVRRCHHPLPPRHSQSHPSPLLLVVRVLSLLTMLTSHSASPQARKGGPPALAMQKNEVMGMMLMLPVPMQLQDAG